jgi:hypothetical protein
MSSASESITGSRWADRVLFAVGMLLLGVFVLHDNHHPTRRDVAAFVVSGLFYGGVLFAVSNAVGGPV